MNFEFFKFFKKPVNEKVDKEKEKVPEQEMTLYVPDVTEKLLGTKEKESSRKLDGGINISVIVKLKDDGQGIFKPKSGEANVRGVVREGTYFKRERAAYLVDKFLDLGLVPPTVIRKIDGEIGSLQEFIPDAKTPGELDHKEWDQFPKRHKEELMKLWLFDMIIWNSDRHGGNLLVKGEKIYAIDNGLAFGNDWLHAYQDFDDEPIPESIKEKFRKFLSWDNGLEILSDLLKELLPPQEVETCIARIRLLGKVIEEEGKIPAEIKFGV